MFLFSWQGLVFIYNLRIPVFARDSIGFLIWVANGIFLYTLRQQVLACKLRQKAIGTLFA
jgi:hypothetical protein